MPYIEVDELPEGTKEADVVPRSDYDAAIAERDEYATQRDGAITQIEEANKAMREAQAKYAGLMLGMGKQTDKSDKHIEKPVHGTTVADLFGKGEDDA